jgi:putative tryptophan/tyrosine transport system substrate-binding protein
MLSASDSESDPKPNFSGLRGAVALQVQSQLVERLPSNLGHPALKFENEVWVISVHSSIKEQSVWTLRPDNRVLWRRPLAVVSGRETRHESSVLAEGVSAGGRGGDRMRRVYSMLIAVALTIVALLSGENANGQQQRKNLYRIGYLSVRADPIPPPIRAGFRDLGLIEGKDFIFEVRSGSGRPENLAAAVSELLALNVDVILTRDGLSALAAKQLTTTLPIVFATSADAIAMGLVKSLARPEGNVTGFTNASPDTAGKRLELLTRGFPGISRVAALNCPGRAGVALQLRETEEAARKLNLALSVADVKTPDEIDQAVKSAEENGAQAIVVLDCSTFPDRLAQSDVASKIPRIYPYERFVRAGGLMYYGPNEDDHYYHSASYVYRILRGTPPYDLPVQQPTNYRLLINLATARAKGISIPPELLGVADEVIE